VLGTQSRIPETAHPLVHPHSLLEPLGGSHTPVDRGLPFVGVAQMIGSGRHAESCGTVKAAGQWRRHLDSSDRVAELIECRACQGGCLAYEIVRLRGFLDLAYFLRLTYFIEKLPMGI
jgi:hypothetical protein